VSKANELKQDSAILTTGLEIQVHEYVESSELINHHLAAT